MNHCAFLLKQIYVFGKILRFLLSSFTSISAFLTNSSSLLITDTILNRHKLIRGTDTSDTITLSPIIIQSFHLSAGTPSCAALFSISSRDVIRFLMEDNKGGKSVVACILSSVLGLCHGCTMSLYSQRNSIHPIFHVNKKCISYRISPMSLVSMLISYNRELKILRNVLISLSNTPPN